MSNINHNDHLNGNVPKYESKVRFVASNGGINSNNGHPTNLNNHMIIKNGIETIDFYNKTKLVYLF